MTSIDVDISRMGRRRPVRRPVLIAMMVYSLGFVGAAAILWHESRRVDSIRPPSYAGISRAASP